MNILFLSRWFPFPPNNGSKLRINHLLRVLSQDHSVTLLAFCDPPLPSRESLEQYSCCSDIQVVPWKPFNRQSTQARLGYFRPLPRSLVDTFSPKMESLIRSTVRQRKFDLVIASQLSMAAYYPSFRGIPAIFDEIELGAFYEQAFTGPRNRTRFLAWLSWLKLQQYLLRLLDMFQYCTVVSDQEYRLFTEYFHKHREKVEVVHNCVDFRDYRDLAVDGKLSHIIFSGSFTYGPNYHAMQWFISQVFPLILSEIPNAHLTITGDHAGLPLPKMDNIHLAGYVNDIRSLIASCDVSIAPIWKGGGTRLKILEAMAIGTPVVATSKGAEGLRAENGKHILIADDPQKFAGHVVQLLRDKNMRASLSSEASRLVKEHYDWQVVMPRFLHLAEKAAAR